VLGNFCNYKEKLNGFDIGSIMLSVIAKEKLSFVVGYYY
jgi:hypothetical protein